MSNGRRFWLPTQKGTELFPKVTQAPAKLVIRGVPANTPLYHAVANTYAGRLKSFHAKAQQTYSLSNNELTSQRFDWGDGARASYINIHGQEIIELEVAVPLLEALQREVPPQITDFWDYALVELVLDDTHFRDGAQALICYAHMIVPREAILDESSVWPVDGVASNIEIRNTVDPIINAAESAATIVDIASTEVERSAASFTVDIRPVRGAVSMLDIYAYVLGADETLPGIVVLWAQNGYVIDDPSGTMGPVHADVQPPTPSDDISNWIQPPVSPTPTTHFDHARREWVFDANGSRVLVYDNGYFYDGYLRPHTTNNPTGVPMFSSGNRTNADMYPVGDPQFMNWPWHKTHNWWFWHIFNIPDNEYIPGYSGPDRLPGRIQMTLFKGAPKLDSTRFVTGHNYDRWCNGGGDVVAPMVTASVTVPVYTNATLPSGPLKDFYGIPALGAVTLDTHRRVLGLPEILAIASWNNA